MIRKDRTLTFMGLEWWPVKTPPETTEEQRRAAAEERLATAEGSVDCWRLIEDQYRNVQDFDHAEVASALREQAERCIESQGEEPVVPQQLPHGALLFFFPDAWSSLPRFFLEREIMADLAT